MKIFNGNVRKLLVVAVGVVSSMSALAGQVVVGNAIIADSPLPPKGNASEISFNFVEMSGEGVVAGDVSLTVDLQGITLDESDISSISGSMLNYFNVSFNASANQLVFNQVDNVAGLASGVVYIPIEVTESSSREDSDNGFEVYVNALDSRTIIGETVESYTYTK